MSDRKYKIGTKSFLRAASLASITKAIGALVAFAYSIILARTLGVESIGRYYIALTILGIASVFGRLGLERAILRFSSVYYEEGRWVQLAGLYRQSVQLVLVGTTIVGAAVYYAIPFLAGSILDDPTLIMPLRLMLLAIVPYSLLLLHAEALKGIGQVSAALMFQSVGIPLVAIPLAIYLRNSLTTSQAILIYAFSSVVVLIVSYVWWIKNTPEIRSVRGRIDLTELLKTSLPMFWAASMLLVMQWTDTLMIAWLERSDDVGVYGIVIRLAQMSSFILVAATSVSAPKFAVSFAQRKFDQLQEQVHEITSTAAWASLPIIVIFVLLPRPILSLFGPEFVRGAPILAILALGQLVNIAFGPVVYLLMMSDRQNIVGRAVTLSTLINIILNYYLINRLGVLGAGISTALTMVFINILLAYKVYRELGIISLVYLPSRFKKRGPIDG